MDPVNEERCSNQKGSSLFEIIFSGNRSEAYLRPKGELIEATFSRSKQTPYWPRKFPWSEESRA